MQQSLEFKYDVASVLGVGQRDYQEDALATDFPMGSGFGYAVLADGMGGHAAGDIASKIVVTEVFSELKLQSGNVEDLRDNVRDVLDGAMQAANSCVRAHTDTNPDARGMGSTLVATVFMHDVVHWISVGDSPLFLFRDGVLTQLNEDHSMAPQIDFMVRSGMMDAEVGRNHPDRNCLTSVLIGDKIERIDCPDDSYQLIDGDMLIVASDGLQFLTDDQIQELLAGMPEDSAEEIATALLAALTVLDDPDQDNASFAVIKCQAKAADETANETADETADEKKNGADWGPSVAAGASTYARAANSTPDDNEKPLNFRGQAKNG